MTDGSFQDERVGSPEAGRGAITNNGLGQAVVRRAYADLADDTRPALADSRQRKERQMDLIPGTIAAVRRRGDGWPARECRRVYLLLAAAALLLQTLVVPVLHRPPAAMLAALADAAGDHEASYASVPDRHGDPHQAMADDGQQGSDRASDRHDHRPVCHFCRLDGAALPTPTAGPLVLVDAPVILPWRPEAAPVVLDRHFLTSLQVRAPPHGSTRA